MTTERWLAGAGIAFVVLALAFLLKLSFDRGWITPGLRLVAGGVTGVTLLAAGLRLSERRPQLAEFLLGGSIAVFYLVGFAGYEVFGLIPYWVALSLMSTTTLLAIVLSEREESVRLAVLGALGGFATPFLLDAGASSPGGLAVYVMAILLGGGAVQLHRGWPLLLGVLGLGGAVTLLLASLATGASETSWALPLMGIVAFWVVTAGSPLVRTSLEGVARPSSPDREMLWTRLSAGFGSAIFIVLISILFSMGDLGTGLVCLGLAAALAALGFGFRSKRRTASPAVEIAALVAVPGILLVVDGPESLPILLAEAALLFILARAGRLPTLSRVAHLLVVVAGIGFLGSGLDASTLDSGLREGMLARLATVGGVALLARITSARSDLYLLAAYCGLLVWFGWELVGLPNGSALVTIAWSGMGAAALIGGVRQNASSAQKLGLATLALVAGKLLLIDLSILDPIWRILIFMGFGAALLGLGYFVNRSDD